MLKTKALKKKNYAYYCMMFFCSLNTNTNCYFQGCHGSIEKSSSGRITLGEQAAALVNPHDRVMALRRVTAAAQVLLARTMVMRALSLLSVRFVAFLATLFFI